MHVTETTAKTTAKKATIISHSALLAAVEYHGDLASGRQSTENTL